jgi:hypothetical protein
MNGHGEVRRRVQSQAQASRIGKQFMIISRCRPGDELISGKIGMVTCPMATGCSEADGTVRFALDGSEYEIDLNTEHAQQLQDALAS